MSTSMHFTNAFSRRRRTLGLLAALAIVAAGVGGVSAAGAATVSTVSGTITGGGAAVTSGYAVLTDAAGNGVAFADTDAKGAYTLDASSVAAGTYTVEASSTSSSYLVTASAPVKIAAGSAVSANVALTKASTIAGKVTGAGTALGSVTVSAYATGSTLDSPAATATTTSAGTYVLGGLRAGSYKIRATTCSTSCSGASFVSGYRGGSTTLAGAATLAIATGASVTGADVALVSGGVVSGIVRAGSGSGAPLALAPVEVDGTATGVEQVAAQTDANGAFSVSGLAAGTYIVRVQAPESSPQYATTYVGGGATPSTARRIAVVAGKTADASTALVAGGSVTGTITGTAGVGLVDITAYAQDPGTSAWLPVTTADTAFRTDTTSAAAYRVDGLLPGSYRLGFTDRSASTGYAPEFSGDSATLAAARTVVVTGTAVTTGANVALAVASPATPTPTATPKPTATPTATPKPTATPTATPSPTATPTAPPATAPPAAVTVTKPVITGTTSVGYRLTASGITTVPSNAARKYRWTRNGDNILNATLAGYTPVAADVGKQIAVTVWASSSGLTTAAARSASVTIAP